MNFWRAMKNHSPWVDITIFTAILSIFIYSAHRITKSSHTDSIQNNAIVPDTLRKVERVPASTPAISEQENSVQVIDLGCLPLQRRQFQVKSSYLRLSANNCGRKKIASAFGVNQTNGYDFTCFLESNSQRLATNYFLINPGENKVQLNLILSNGRRQDELIEIQKVQ